MIWQMHQLLLVCHIFLAITWVGGILFIGWGVYPASQALAPRTRQTFLYTLMKKTHHLFSLAGLGVILTGIVLGTFLGPLRNWHIILHTTYGHIWLTALIIASFTLLWGVCVGYRQSMRLFNNDALWQAAERGNPRALQKAMKQTVVLESVEVLGFIVIIICMVLL